MKIFAIFCTRNKKIGPVTGELTHTLSSYGINVKILANQNSIFEAYQKGVISCKASSQDIIILCHDDIKILSSRQHFLAALSKCKDKDTGIVGPAGTTYLGENAVWWDQEKWSQGHHRGQVKHRANKGEPASATYYGECGQVVALDGLFLAARKEVWEKVGLQKPEYFEGNWDFYDIHYTTKSHSLGYKNYVIPIDMIHLSNGELVGRDSWHKNREAFINNTKLPIRI
tara:strand:- start:1767 stop:2450 length:684 start_codon:yes stop_codon:yes gene_type:complete